MRIVKALISVVFLIVVSGNAAGQTDPNDLSAYYGFDELEIIKLDWDIKNLTIADFNGDGRNDIAVVNNRNAKIELLIQREGLGPSEAEVAVDPQDIDVNTIKPLSRFEKQSIAVSQKVSGFACGDLNSDGMMDLAFYGEPRGLYVILQKTSEVRAGKPTTLSWQTKKEIKINDGLLSSNSLICADLNNDGASDLALAGSDSVYIILQKKDGSLAEPVKYPTAAQTLGINIGDLNGDKINDLILITNDSQKEIHVRFGLKTGQLGPEVQLSIEKPYALELCNIDGIQGDELLTVDRRSGRLICYKFATNTQKNADWPILFYPLTSGQGDTKRDLVVGDFDGNGLVDVTISNPGAAELIFYKQLSGLGLAEPVRFPAFADIESLSVADIDRDGKSEIAVLSVKEKVIGLSKFENDRLSFPKPINLVGDPLAMELADLDYNGNIDCLYISKDANDIRYLRASYDLAADDKGKQPKIMQQTDESLQFLELKELTSDPEGLKVLDVDQDGLPDVLIFIQYESPILVRQTQKKKFELITSKTVKASLIKDASQRSIALADIDGKIGKELLVAQKNFARSLVFSEGKSWSIIDQYNARSTENDISAVAAFDIDGKGAANRPAILLLDGQKGQLQILKTGDDNIYKFDKELDVGTWNAASHLKSLFEPLTGDDAKSILLFDGEKFALITPPNGGNVPYHMEQQFSYETQIKDGIYGNLAAGDINSDNLVDIIMVEYMRNHIEILTLDSEMKPISAMRFKLFEQKGYRDEKGDKSGVEPREIKIADVTNDGKNDLVTVIHDRLIIYPQD